MFCICADPWSSYGERDPTVVSLFFFFVSLLFLVHLKWSYSNATRNGKELRDFVFPPFKS